jgi:hypothetical protein
VIVAVGPVVTVKKSERFATTFSSSGGNLQENIAEGFLSRFPRLRQFP